MSRFYFDIHDGERYTRDEFGLELITRGAVRDAAIEALPTIAQDHLPDGEQRVFSVKVRAANGSYIFHATLSLIAEWLEENSKEFDR